MISCNKHSLHITNYFIIWRHIINGKANFNGHDEQDVENKSVSQNFNHNG